MSLYYPASQSRQPHNNFGNTTETGPTFRLTCVNVNHVTYNYLMENASPTTADSVGYNYGNGCGGSLPCYQTLTSTLQQPGDDSGGGGGRSYSLPSSCESPMSLPAFSPPTNQSFFGHQNINHFHQQAYLGTNLFQDEVQSIATAAPASIEDFNLDEQFSLDIAGTASSEDDGEIGFQI